MKNLMKEIWTYKRAAIKEAEEELRRWKEEESCWCSIFETLTRKRDGSGCEKHERCNIGDIMMATCNSCIHWENNKLIKEVNKNADQADKTK